MMPVAVRHRWLIFLSILGLLLLAREPASAARARRTNLRLEGYVGHAPAGVKPTAHLVLQFESRNYEFDLAKTAVISGHGSKSQWLQDIKPNQNTLVLRGSTSAVGALTNASSGQKLRIDGYYRTGSHELQVTKLVPVSPDTPVNH